MKCGSYCRCEDCKNIKIENFNQSHASTRTSSISVTTKYNKECFSPKRTQLNPCMIIINNYTINENFDKKEGFDC